MTYHELLELFKNGALDESQRAQVEADIEKHEAISDYLLETADIPALEVLSLRDTDSADGSAALSESAEQSEQFVKAIKAYIARAFAKAGLIVGACVLGIVLFVIFGLPKLVDAIYYNPAKIVGTGISGDQTTQISLDMAIYSELFLPCRSCQKVICDAEGFGAYNIYIPGACAGKIVRNRLTLYEPNVIEPEYPEWFGVDVSRRKRYNPSETPAPSTENNTFDWRSDLQRELDDDKTYIAYIALKDIMSYSEVTALFDEPAVNPAWYALCWQNEQGKFENNVGTLMGFSDASGFFSSDISYPYLDVAAFTGQNYPCLTQDSLEGDPSAASIEQHVSSMLRYVNDHQTLSLLSDVATALPKNYYAQAARQIDRHGLYVYCFITETDKATLLRLAQNENITNISLKDSRPVSTP